MNDQDRDLILAYASGQLSGADADAASARIASEPELAAELADQELAMSALSSIPAATMTATERAGLRSNLTTQLNLEPAPVVAAAPKRSIAWWKPVAGLAAAAAVVAAVVVLPSTLQGDDDSITALQPAMDAVEEETLSSASDSVDGSSADDGASPEAGATTTTAASELAGESDAAADFRTDDVLDATEGNDTPAEAEDSLNAAQYKLAPVDPSRGSTLESCVEQLSDELPPGDLITLGTTIVDGTETLFVGIADESGIVSVASIDLDACRVIEIAR